MTAQSTAISTPAVSRHPAGMFLGFGTVLRKELTEWFKSPKAMIVAGISVVGAVVTTLIPLIVEAAGEASSEPFLTKDPTANVLLGWSGQTVPLIAVVATMAMISVERDRGTLAWSLTNPVSRTSIIAAKFLAAMLVLSSTAILLPLVVSVGLATVAYGALPDLRIIGTFGLLYVTLPAFYVALTIGLGTFIKSTGGVAGIAFVVMFVPLFIGGILPTLNELAPTSIGTWAMAIATGKPASMLTLAGWLVSVAAIAIGARIAFDRQEL